MSSHWNFWEKSNEMPTKGSNCEFTMLQGFESVQVQTLVLAVKLAVWLERVRIVRGCIEGSRDGIL